MAKTRKQNNWVGTAGPIFLALAGLAVLAAGLLRGNNVALFNPKGLIASEQHSLTMLVVGIMLAVAIPAVFMLYFIAWKYRETNEKAKRDPEAGSGKLANTAIWGIPIIMLTILSLILWPATHRLVPQKAIASDAKPMTIQVVALRWKWLFIYPEQHIATVNYVQIPKGTPVTFELTADETPMSSFWIPNLGGMLYAMTGHVNKLNLVGDKLGDYTGSTAEINGAGFARMKFTANVSSKEDFDLWVKDVSTTSGPLGSVTYGQLLKPSEDNKQAFYALADSNLYDTVLMKYDMVHGDGAHE